MERPSRDHVVTRAGHSSSRGQRHHRRRRASSREQSATAQAANRKGTSRVSVKTNAPGALPLTRFPLHLFCFLFFFFVPLARCALFFLLFSFFVLFFFFAHPHTCAHARAHAPG